MGLFGTYIYSDGQWTERIVNGEYLSVDIHDSSIATIDYRPAPASSGRLYLGYEPRHYFDDTTASDPIDAAKGVAGFVAWAKTVAGVSVMPEQVEPLLASSEGSQPYDVFVEDSVRQLLRLLGIPVPEDLRRE